MTRKEQVEWDQSDINLRNEIRFLIQNLKTIGHQNLGLCEKMTALVRTYNVLG